MYKKLLTISKKLKSMPAWERQTIGVLFLFGGAFWFLPVLGLWMIPFGMLFLSRDFVWARRGYCFIILWLRKRRKIKVS